VNFHFLVVLDPRGLSNPQYRSAWVPALHSCLSVATKKGVLGLNPTIFANLALLIIMFVGLIILRRHGYSRVGFTYFLWKQVW
jgi:hypothetical protein